MQEPIQNYQPPVTQPKDPNTTFLIELVGGFFGMLGLGYFYVGRTNDGLIRLLLWMAFLAIGWITISILSAVLVGLLCIPIQLALQFGVPIWSAITLKNKMV